VGGRGGEAERSGLTGQAGCNVHDKTQVGLCQRMCRFRITACHPLSQRYLLRSQEWRVANLTQVTSQQLGYGCGATSTSVVPVTGWLQWLWRLAPYCAIIARRRRWMPERGRDLVRSSRRKDGSCPAPACLRGCLSHLYLPSPRPLGLASRDPEVAVSGSETMSEQRQRGWAGNPLACPGKDGPMIGAVEGACGATRRPGHGAAQVGASLLQHQIDRRARLPFALGHSCKAFLRRALAPSCGPREHIQARVTARM
jgi:hypothetical protein